MKAGFKIALAAWSVLLWSLFSLSAFADKRVALVLGNSAYAHVTKLSNPANDAHDLAETLRGLDFDVISQTNADMRALDSALEEFERKSQGADVALFFFAGHGLQFKGQNYLLPIDANLEDEVSLRYNTLSIEKVRDALGAASGVKIMILDACRNNPLSDKLIVRSAGLTRAVELTRGLARLDRTEGMVVAYATQADQVAQDGSGRNSPFSSALIRRLKEPNLEIATLFRRVAQDVYEQTGGKQRPELSISLLQDFYLNTRDDDARFWRRIGANASESELHDFITKFPSSPFVNDAQNRIYALEGVRREREEMNRQIAALEAERRRFQEVEAKRQAAEKRDQEQAELDRLAIARQGQERLEAERRQAEAQQAKKREQEELEKARQAAQVLANERKEVERVAAEQLVKQRLAALKLEEDKKEAERLAAEAQERKRIDAEQRATDERERVRQEVERLAVEKRAAEAQAAERLSGQKPEADNLEKVRTRLAALEQEKRQQVEQDAAREKQDENCARETADFHRLSARKQKDGLEKLKAQTTCPGLAQSIDKILAELAPTEAKMCANESQALARIDKNDLAALKDFALKATCATARKSAAEQVVKLQATGGGLRP
ncbi:caspase family protein [Rhodoblastus sp. 17X3]|uniref:caspase family protein n=1 Tax=Rhodoblastus sp. 17X3 TaxID=3047026 RepID=UPI0024B63D74|nr:caspase family protein [Rhodoblastus sp. 17X3]MDI9849768.1 caspase family protein [Rhodoblastus sp. 17X3]